MFLTESLVLSERRRAVGNSDPSTVMPPKITNDPGPGRGMRTIPRAIVATPIAPTPALRAVRLIEFCRWSVIVLRLA
jgi:hypothetical protein